ncbi:site-specific DNA-methyltransferase [Vibrio astriarenae]
MTITKMDGNSLDISAQRKQELKQLFPSAFTETRNDAGEIVETLDFERLKAELGSFSDVYDNRRERYGMDWPGKRDCLRLIQEPSRATLKPCREESVDFDNTENLFIEGDNLEVLKLLQKSYYGQVKMIYIDPPYNTGKEFIYPDNFSENLDTYLEYAGLKEVGGEGKKWSSNSSNEGRFHTKWLNMMYPRLYLARNLLREDGVVFISIDENEVENLRRLCDEIFGEENFVSTIVWEKRYSPQNAVKWFSESHDFVIVYARNKLNWYPNLLERSNEMNARYKNPDNDPRGVWKPADATAQGGHGTKGQFYELTAPNGKKHTLPNGRCWLYTEEVFQKMVSENRIWFGADGNNVPAVKRFLSEVKQGTACQTIWKYSDVGHNQEAKKEVNLLFPESSVFDTPKPTRLIERMLKVATDKGDLVLDFFSGSATTAHSVMQLNSKDAGSRKFIMVQLPEACEESSEPFKVGFSTISDIAKERIRRAGQKIHTEIENKSQPDLGFKVLKLDQSNFKQWQAPSKDVSDDDLVQQMELLIEHVESDVSQEDLLYELLIKAGIMPTEKIEAIELAEQALFSVAEGTLLIHLAETIDQSLINAVLEQAPSQFICLDSAFHGNDQLKANAVQTFMAYNQNCDNKIDQIEFKTV